MSDLVAQAKQFTTMGEDHFLKTFAAVPDDKLTWTPSSTSKSALRIAAHAGLSNQAFAGILRGEEMPTTSLDELSHQMNAAEQTIVSREQAVQLIEESVKAVHAALDALTPEMIDSVVETPVVTAPMPFFMNLPGLHLNTHAAQVDYLQTMWGDFDFHM